MSWNYTYRPASLEAIETMGFHPEEKPLASCFIDNGRAFATDKRIVLSIDLRERRLSSIFRLTQKLRG